MTERAQENLAMPTKDDVLVALRAMKALSLGAYETEDPRAKHAQGLLDAWRARLDQEAGTDPVARIRASVEKSIVLIEAGYDDDEMLSSAIGWLDNDLADAEIIKNPELTAEIEAKIEGLDEALKSKSKS